jgi:hypothetical protein
MVLEVSSTLWQPIASNKHEVSVVWGERRGSRSRRNDGISVIQQVVFVALKTIIQGIAIAVELPFISHFTMKNCFIANLWFAVFTQAKSSVLVSFISLLAVAPFVLVVKLSAQEGQGVEEYSLCSQIVNHKSLYRHGEFLAIGWMYWLKVNKADETRFPVKTRESFITRATIGLNKKNGITEKKNSDLYFCNMGFMTTAIGQRWSALHDGLVDYLPKSQKVKFLSLPER